MSPTGRRVSNLTGILHPELPLPAERRRQGPFRLHRRTARLLRAAPGPVTLPWDYLQFAERARAKGQAPDPDGTIEELRVTLDPVTGAVLASENISSSGQAALPFDTATLLLDSGYAGALLECGDIGCGPIGRLAEDAPLPATALGCHLRQRPVTVTHYAEARGERWSPPRKTAQKESTSTEALRLHIEPSQPNPPLARIAH
ncbi:hypothetical protein GCM10009790_20240 [Georgenia ruanii]